MMNPRQQYLETLLFGHPDRIPFSPGGGRESTRARWYTEGVPEGANPNAYLNEILGIEGYQCQYEHSHPGVDFLMRPQFEEKVLEHKDGHYICQDWKGNICEISDEFDVTYLKSAKDFCTRRWIKCPVETRDDWEQMKLRYDLDAPGRFPDDFDERCAKISPDRDWALTINFHGPFWQMREWAGFEGLCMMMIDDPDLVADMATFWTEFVAQILDRILARVVPDCIFFNEDMAYKAKCMVSPAMVRDYCKPSWVRWARQGRSAGVPLIDVDSDGFVGELIPIWIESGINVSDPVEVAAHNDINAYRDAYGRAMAYRGGIDKRAMAKGGDVLRAEMKRIEPVVTSGGFIPSCDHGVPADVSWENFVDYARQLAQRTGWL